MKSIIDNLTIYAIINESTSLASEAAKLLCYGPEFERDSRHTALQRLEMEFIDLEAAIHHLRKTLGGKIHGHHEYMTRFNKRSSVLQMEEVLHSVGLLPVPNDYYNDTINMFMEVEDFYKNYPVSTMYHPATKMNWAKHLIDVIDEVQRGEKIRVEKQDIHLHAIFMYFAHLIINGIRPMVYKDINIDIFKYQTEREIEDIGSRITFYKMNLACINDRLNVLSNLPNKAITSEIEFLTRQVGLINDLIHHHTRP